MSDKRTLHILVDYTPFDNKIETYWRECFKDQDFDEFDVNIIEGQMIQHDSYLWSDTKYKVSQLNSILDLVQKNKIKNGDIFIFTNAWNFVAVPLSYFRYEFKLDIKLIGFWGNSLFNQASPMWWRFKKSKKGWGRDFESSLFKAYDLNCFLCQEHWELFQRKYAQVQGAYLTEVAITGYPFEYLTRNIPEIEKSNKIIFPYELNDEFQVQIFKGLGSEIQKYDFVFAREIANNRWKYKLLLNESIGMFCGARTESDPVLLYEGMLHGLIPFVPNRLMYQYVFPEYYQYPSMLSKPKNNKFLYVVRNRIQLEDFIQEKLDNYSKWKDIVKKDAKELGDKYYRNEPFKLLLNKF